jgi:hypothetical protein
MKRYEYRIELLTFSCRRRSDEEILEALNRFGQEGWRHNRTFSSFPSVSWKANVKLLLERELTDEV